MKTKSLLIAICLLVVSATMLGTASFAWFSMNTEVAVDGIEVEAYSDALYLQISNNNSTYGDTTTFNATKKSLRLVTQVPVDTSELCILTPEEATGDPVSGVTYYAKSEALSSNDTYVADNYLVVTSFGQATELDSYYRIEFVPTANNATAVTGVAYYEKLTNGNGYKAVEVTYEDEEEETEAQSVYGLYVAYSYVVTEDEDFVDGTTYYVLNADRAFAEVTVGEGDEMDEGVIYFEKVAGIEALGAGVYTEADEDNYIAYYTTDTNSNYVIATDLVPAEKLDGKYYTFEETDAIDDDVDATEIAAGAKVWWQNANGDYICVYHNTTSDAVDISDRIFWGKAYSDTLGAVGATDMITADVGIIKDSYVKNYVYSDTLYLRSALNTNDGKNLRIENIEIGGRKSALSDALRIHFVATNGKGEQTTYTFDNGSQFTAQTLFNTILGDTKEIVTVRTYIYFDGTDAASLTATTAAGEFNGQTVSIEFAINDVDYSVNP